MAIHAFTLISVIVLTLTAINAQSTSTTSTPFTSTITTAVPDTYDASVGGKVGSPGAQLRFSTKALDAIYSHALEMITKALKSMVIPDVIVPIGGGMLTIKSVRVTEAKIPTVDRQLMPPNRIRSRLSGGRIVSIGEWQYKPMGGARSIAQGIFRTVIVNASMNLTNQLSKSWDNKPTVQTNECKAYLGDFRVEIEGFGDNTTVIDHCDNLLCQRIRSYFEDAVCNTARQYIKDTINQKLLTFPSRIPLGSTGNRYVLDYGLLNGEPKVTEQYIQAYLQGEVLSRNVVSAPFHANELSTLDDRQKMISFPLSDYAFNTLFHHAHAQQFRFSAADMLNSSNAIKDLLKLNCSGAGNSNIRRFKAGVLISSSLGVDTSRGSFCLGTVFDNVTNMQFPVNAYGDLVFKSQRPLAVFVRQPQKSYFGATSGTIEAFGPAGSDGKRELLGRAEIELLRGDFFPALDGCNITGSINITDVQLTQASPAPVQARIRSIADETLIKLAKLSAPILKQMFNSFLDDYAQFPVPLVDGYECASAELRWTQRTMQVDCDVRVLPEATRKAKKN